MFEVEIRHADFRIKSAHGILVPVLLPDVYQPAVPIEPIIQKDDSMGQDSVAKD